MIDHDESDPKKQPDAAEFANDNDETLFRVIETDEEFDFIFVKETDPDIIEAFRSMQEARRTAMYEGIPILGEENIRDIWAALKYQIPAPGEHSSVDEISPTFPIETATRLMNSLSLIMDGVNGDKALGVKRGRGKKSRGTERMRQWGIAMALHLMIIDQPGADRNDLAEEVASSPIGVIGRDAPYCTGYIIGLHLKWKRKANWSLEMSTLEKGVFSGMLLELINLLRERYER